MHHQLTQYAVRHCQQRGIPLACIDLIWGRPLYQGDRTRAFLLDQKRLERVRHDLGQQAAEACKDVVVLVGGETVITVFHKVAHQRSGAGSLRRHRIKARRRRRALAALTA